jgi:prepilin-type N-terminal cleavage/methylation domain-containing protein
LDARSDGYTLIEVIVALAIFTMMAALSVAALDQGLRQYRKLMHEGTDFWKYAGSLWINKSFSGVFENVVHQDKVGQVPYFECGQSMISYASVSPLAGNMPVIAWLVREEGAVAGGITRGRATIGDGTVAAAGSGSVVYYELPLNAKGGQAIAEDYLLQNYKSGNRMVILDRAENIVFNCKALNSETKISSWRESYSGRTGGRLPEAVRILYTKDGRPGMMYFSIYANAFDYASANYAF